MIMQLNDLINEIAVTCNVANLNFMEITKYLQCNNWFGCKPEIINGKAYLNEEDQDVIRTQMKEFFMPTELSREKCFQNDYPATYGHLRRFISETGINSDTLEYLYDFLVYHIDKEIFRMDDSEVHALVEAASVEMTRNIGDILTFFLSWLQEAVKTQYKAQYLMEKRYSSRTDAYDMEEYFKLIYYLLNEDYIAENHMYEKAVQSKAYADEWLYLSLHLICSLRQTDLENLGHPRLTASPEETLIQIINGEYSDKDARLILLSIIKRLSVLHIVPHKVSRHSNIPEIKFIIPETSEVHFGRMFAICEAHHRLSLNGEETPLIHKNTSYEYIRRVMGPEIGELFRYQNFSSRSANKSYLQASFLLSGEILDSDEPRVKGFIVASMARSHKGSAYDFAQTTAVYLRDAKLSGLTPEFVARELFERGVLSHLASMMLSILSQGVYDRLPVQDQTKLIKALNLSPFEVENTIKAYETTRINAISQIRDQLTGEADSDATLKILHRIGCGAAYSKQPEYMCLMTALRRECPYTHACGTCEYEISTKSTFYLLIEEYNRLANVYMGAETNIEKEKAAYIIRNYIVPQLDEILTNVKSQYGEETYLQYEQLLMENTTHI